MFPIRDNIPSRTHPIATWTIIGANLLVFVFELSLPDRRLEGFIYLFGIVPRRYAHPAWAQLVGFPADDYWPFLTSMFLHGGWFHIISNMWTLWVFGDNVEDRMGSIRFTLYYLLCGASSGVIQAFTNASSRVPVIGASGAIAGVLAAYFLLYPGARIMCMIPIFFYPLFVEVYAFLFILIWFGAQFLNGTLSLLAPHQAAGIAWWAHIGGFGTGIIAHRLFLVRKRPNRRSFPDEDALERLRR